MFENAPCEHYEDDTKFKTTSLKDVQQRLSQVESRRKMAPSYAHMLSTLNETADDLMQGTLSVCFLLTFKKCTHSLCYAHRPPSKNTPSPD